MSAVSPLRVRYLGMQQYLPVWRAMSRFTDSRDENVADELWLLQHFPVFTQGQAGKPEHLLHPGDIPVVQSDRGGQVTYHGPGQLVAYPLIDLRRRGLGVRDMVTLLETLVIDCLASYQLSAYAKPDAPGVYLSVPRNSSILESKGDVKIASLGLRVRRGCCFHGVSLNVSMDLTPFTRINPCGYDNMVMTDLQAQVDTVVQYKSVENQFAHALSGALQAPLLECANPFDIFNDQDTEL